MRLFLPAVLISLCSCAIDDEAPRVATTEQAVVLVFADGGLRAKGSTPLAHLGAVIAACPAGGYVAGAPGDDSLWISPLKTRVRPPRPFVIELTPYPVACLGANDNLRVLAGGPDTTFALFTDAGSAQIFNSRTDSFDTSPGFLAVGSTQPGVVTVYANTMTSTGLNTPTFTSAPPFAGVGNSVSWSLRGDLLVGISNSRTAGIYYADVTSDGGRLLASAFAIPNPDPVASISQFGKVVLVGDVSPEPGEEYIVSAPGTGFVYVFSGQQLVATYGGGVSFGAALALEGRSFGGLHALWVGEPERDLVHRYMGSQADTFTAPPAGLDSDFGAAIALDERGLVVIGAPRYTETVLTEIGAVFEATYDAGTSLGQTAACDAGLSCKLPGCTTGLCVGGVFCQQTQGLGTDCAVGERCDLGLNRCILGTTPDAGMVDAGLFDGGTPDAGTLDAGTPDAGAPDAGFDAGVVDAGTPDAGAADAGTPDGGSSDGGTADGGMAGPQTFHTCGCTSGGLPLLLLALGLTRRRRQ